MNFSLNLILLFIFLLTINIINCQLKMPPLYKCVHDENEEKNNVIYQPIKTDKTSKRRVENEQTVEFEDFKIYLDFKNLEEDLKKYGLFSQRDFFVSSMKKAVSTLETLLKVKPLIYDNYNMEDSFLRNNNITSWETDKFGNDAIKNNVNFKTLKIHLAIFGTLVEMHESTLATASAKVFQDPGGQPLVGIVKINKDINYTLPNSDVYFESILVHEFTHILGFSKFFFETYSHNLVIKTDKFGINRMYLNSPKVLAVAKRYFNCENIEGVELENQGGSGTIGSHWEARILLGEYMNGYAYTEEQVISEFTLAVLEDSGYYKPNYYTGGLMRFGKHKGCEFLTEKCVNSTHQINPNFENEFYDTIIDGSIIQASCSSGRQSRTYNAWWPDSTLAKEFQYFENPNVTGYLPADYCPVPQRYYQEEEGSYFAGHCSIKGDVSYGSMLNYYTSNFDPTSKNIRNFTGETFSDHSYCYLSSLSKNEIVTRTVRATCYETFCSEKSLTVKIFNDYIVCPRAGGKIKVEGYGGYFLCPDYNLICSGTVLCNNIFDCAEKKSEIREESFTYDYEIKTSQNIQKADVEEEDNITNYELSENGTCTQYCKHCNGENICYKCAEGYGRKLEIDKSIKCYPLAELTEGFYKDAQGIYINCMDNCTTCEDKKTCTECKHGFYYKDKKCNQMTNEIEEKMIDNCAEFDKKFNCKKCIEKYAFNQTNRNSCLSIEENFSNNYYTKDNGTSYYPCYLENENCTLCFYNRTEFRVKCLLCKDDLVLLDKGKGLCTTKEEINASSKYYLINETHAGTCSKDIEYCLSCDSATNCFQCKYTYVFDNELNACVDKNQLTTSEDSGTSSNTTSNNETKKSKSGTTSTSTSDKRKKVKKKINNSSNYFCVWNIIMLETMIIIFLLINL